MRCGLRHVMHAGLIPGYFGPASRRLFGAYHPATGTARAAVLLCAPLLHEHVRSYRFFAQVAAELAGQGLACLRFDYFGSGDSAGDDRDFLPDATAQDLLLAAGELRRRAGEAPLILLAVRGAALFACRDAAACGADALWLWQPVTDGADYLRRLQRRDRAESESRERYPLRRGGTAAPRQGLMGFSVSADFPDQLARLQARLPAGIPTTVLDAEGRAHLPGSRFIALPETVTRWEEEIELADMIPQRDAQPALRELVAGLREEAVHG